MAGIRKKLKAIKKRLRRMVSKTPKRKFYYGFFSKYCRLRPKWVLIESFHGQTVSDSGLVLAQEIARLYPGQYRVFYATEDKKKHRAFVDAAGLQVELVDVTTFRYTRILACARHIFSNASLPIYFIKRPGQVYMQTWHGTPLKTLGKQMRMGIESMYNVQHNFLQADYLTQPNAFTRDVILRDYNLEALYTGKVVMAGYPRNKVFMEPEKGAALRRQLGLEDKTVYAYMPTWRGTSNRDVDTSEYAAQVHAMLSVLDKSMTDDQLLFVNFHPILHDAIQLGKYRHIRPFPRQVSNYEFLNCVDALITDYSSVFFDFSLTGKPIILFIYDYKEYTADRGMYLDVQDLPFRKITSAKALGRCLRDGECLEDDYRDTDYSRMFLKYDSPDISEKLLKLAFTGDPGDLEVIDYGKNKEKTWQVLYPRVLNGRADLETLARLADDHTVVLLERKWFKRDISPLLHDEFNDKFTYVITTMTTPRTYVENLLCHLGVGAVQRRVRRRDMQRTFPNLQLDGDYRRDYGCFAVGCAADPAALRPAAMTACGGKDGCYRVDYTCPADFVPRQAALLSDKLAVLSLADLPANSGSTVQYNVRSVIEGLDLYNRGRCLFGLVGENTADGRTQMLVFTDAGKYAAAKRESNRFDSIGYYYNPYVDTFGLPAGYGEVQLQSMRDSVDPVLRDQFARRDLTPQPTPMALLPYLDPNTGYLSALLCTPDVILESMPVSAPITGLSCKGNVCHIRLHLRHTVGEQVQGAKLIYRSLTEKIEIPLDCRTIPAGDGCRVQLTLPLNAQLPLKEVYWDIRLEVEQYGCTHRIKLRCADPGLKWKLFFTNCQADAGSGHILFPYFGKKGVLCYCYRPLCEYDTAAVRLREITAYSLYLLLRPLWQRQKNWVVYEKFCKTAQDNSYYFFKYCMEHLPEKERRHIYYIMDPREPDYKNVAGYGRQVVPFMSLRHMLLTLSMRICISSDSTSHLYVWRSKPSIVRRAIKKKEELFLQHGVTAMKRVDQLFGKKGSSPMTYFVTCSRPEHDIVVREFGYAPKNVPITGFARWDVLEDKSTPDDPFILMMPTWRSWLEEVDNDTFLQSEYYQNYSALLTDPALDQMLRRNHTRLVFYLHPKFAGYMDNFKDKISPRVTCIPFGQQPLNELMMRCKLLVTDYSSVCWDVLYQNKPVVYYQFDYDLYDRVHGSYLDMTTQLPGDRFTDVKDLVPCLDSYAAAGFEMKPKYRKMAKQYFRYRDNHNSRRIYRFLKSNGY